jgi:eukaryotic-like serine/threonine-protein kinase
MTIISGTRLGHYEILSTLGVGGMGEVYLAQDLDLGRRIALKLLPSEFTKDDDRLRRFQQEARAASALNHPNILTIHEIGSENSTYFIATEYIEGQTLRDYMSGAKMKMFEVLDVATQVASALAAAHAAGVVHRDIKPENIMLRLDRIVKVLDFGLAKLTEAPTTDTEAATLVNTEAGVVMGTARYMSPEQVRGLAVDARTDVWSLGVVIHEMLTGRVPFSGETASDVIAAVLEREPQPLMSQVEEIPSELKRIVSKALRKDCEERYQTIRDMLVDLKSLKQELELDAKLKRSTQSQLEGIESTAANIKQLETAKQITATPTSSAQYLVGEIKRRKLVLGIAGVVLLAVASAAYFGYFARDSTLGREAITSIAVLPFVNASNEPDTEYLSDGISESLINSLSQLPGLKVIARSSVFRYKGREVDPQAAGRELGVQAVLTGRVTQRGDSLLINVELMDARDNSHIWGDQYSRKLSDIFAIQGEIAKDISDRLRLKLTGENRQQLARRYTENLRAYQHYAQGRSYADRRTRDDLLTAIDYYEKAIEEDRNYALAYAGLAGGYANLGIRGYIDPAESRQKAEAAAHKALTLDENLAEAHVAIGRLHLDFVPYDFSISNSELRRAIELSPSLALAHQYLGLSLVREGRLDESMESFLKARQLDPLSPIIARQAALTHLLKRDYVRALEVLRQSDDLGPLFTATWEIGIYVQNKLYDEALQKLANEKLQRKNDSLLIYFTGMIYAAQGRQADALEIIKELEGISGTRFIQAHFIAKIYATLKEKELAFQWLERGLKSGVIGAFYEEEPVWDTIRTDPRFPDLLRRMGIPT